jgi:protein TonB
VLVPAYSQRNRTTRPRERAIALAAVAVVQLGFGLALLRGLHVDISRTSDVVQRLIDITLVKPPPPPPPPPVPVKPAPTPHEASAPKAAPEKLGGSPGPKPAHAPPSVTPIVSVKPTAPPSGGGTGTGPAVGAGAGGGTGGNGFGSGEGGGTDLELISGDITQRDYPKHLGNAGVGGTVSVSFTVLTNGRVTGCRVTRSSGVPELDGLTCRLAEERFRFRPATDRYGRPVSEVVDWDQDWIPYGR